eukprot:Sspe_Gene.53226::Locus_29446_Transcript_2_3_Confidence_0.400_Length_1494::g.53226::m.53226
MILGPTRPRSARPSSARNRVAAGPKLTDRVREWHPTRPVVTGFPQEVDGFRSTALAAEVILKHLSTADDPCAKRTAAACMLLYRVGETSAQQGRLILTLLREILSAVYLTTAESIQRMVDGLAEGDLCEDYFIRRADYVAEQFLSLPTYFSRVKYLEGTTAEVLGRNERLENRLEMVKRVLERAMGRWESVLLFRNFRCWRVVTRLQKQFRVMDRMSHGKRLRQIEEALGRWSSARLRLIQMVFISTLQSLVMQKKRSTVRSIENELREAKRESRISRMTAILSPKESEEEKWADWAREELGMNPDYGDFAQLTADLRPIIQAGKGVMMGPAEVKLRGAQSFTSTSAEASYYMELVQKHQNGLVAAMRHYSTPFVDGLWCIPLYHYKCLIEDCSLPVPLVSFSNCAEADGSPLVLSSDRLAECLIKSSIEGGADAARVFEAIDSRRDAFPPLPPFTAYFREAGVFEV